MRNLFRKIVVLVGMSLFGVILSLGLIEVGYRGTLFLSSPPAKWTDRPPFYINPVSAQSLQGNDYNPSKPKGVFRIAVVGDSFTFAPYMQFDDAFPAQLERFLLMSEKTMGDGPKSVEVINYGVPGYSTTHEVQEARKAVAEGADLIILQITLNDPQRKQYQPTGLTGKNEFGPYAPSVNLQPILNHWKSLRYFLERIHNTETHKRYIHYYHHLFEDEPSWKSFDSALGRLSRMSKKRNVPVIAALFPLFGVPLNDSYPFTDIHNKIISALKIHELPYLDLFETYKNIPLARLQVLPGGDFHPNEIAHRMAAEQIYLWMEKLGAIPTHFFQAPRFRARTDIRLLERNQLSHSTS